MQNAVDAAIKNLLEAGHIKRVDKTSDEMFIQPVVISVKKGRSVKIALDARSLNDAILKNKYQIRNLENPMEKKEEIVNANKRGDVFFTSLEMHYAFGHTIFHPDTTNIVISRLRCDSTGAYGTTLDTMD